MQIVKCFNIFSYLNFCRVDFPDYQELMRNLVAPLEGEDTEKVEKV